MNISLVNEENNLCLNGGEESPSRMNLDFRFVLVAVFGNGSIPFSANKKEEENLWINDSE